MLKAQVAVAEVQVLSAIVDQAVLVVCLVAVAALEELPQSQVRLLFTQAVVVVQLLTIKVLKLLVLVGLVEAVLVV